MRLRLVLIWFVAVCLLYGCSQSSYRIFSEDDKWYIEFLDEEPVSTPHVECLPQFDSAAALKKVLKSKKIKLSDLEIATLRSKGTNDLKEICNPNEICDLRLPEGLAYEFVAWAGRYYWFSINSENIRGSVDCIYYDYYIQRFEDKYRNAISENFSVLDDTTVEDRNARIVYYTTAISEQKSVMYKIETGASEIYVHEEYVVEYFPGKALPSQRDSVSETVPKCIYLCGTDGTNYWYGTLRGFEERPSVEWLSSFGLKPIE